MSALPLEGNTFHKAEMKYTGKFGHTFGRIHHISLDFLQKPSSRKPNCVNYSYWFPKN